jgi:hypothetical protein
MTFVHRILWLARLASGAALLGRFLWLWRVAVVQVGKARALLICLMEMEVKDRRLSFYGGVRSRWGNVGMESEEVV